MHTLTYVIAKVEEAINENIKPSPEMPVEVGLPLVAPDDCPIFSEDIMRKLQFYEDNAIAVEDFETWLTFLEIIANQLELNPATDFGKLASVLNRYRLNSGKDPL